MTYTVGCRRGIRSEEGRREVHGWMVNGGKQCARLRYLESGFKNLLLAMG